MTIMCKECKDTKTLVCNPGKGGALIPRTCSNQAAIQTGGDPCGLDPFVILPAKSKYVDQQELKMQVWSPTRLRAYHTASAISSRISPCLRSLIQHLHPSASPTNSPVSSECLSLQMLLWGVPLGEHARGSLASMSGGASRTLVRPQPGVGITLACTTEQLRGLAAANNFAPSAPLNTCRDQNCSLGLAVSCDETPRPRWCMQERPEDVPTGELPRSVTLLVDRQLVGKVSPGTRVVALGIHTTTPV